MRPSNIVVFCAIDDLVPVSNKPLTGFPDFLDSLAADGIPCVWITSRNRHQLDATLRRMSHSDPFIAEGGSCVYLAEDYFHLKPAHTVRLGRFIAIPVAKPQPAAEQALAHLSEETGISVVPLRSLTPRELSQNTGLAKNEAEFVRQRDFDELFFFAGTSDHDIQRFCQQAVHFKYSVRPHGSLWSLAINPSLLTCVRELRKLYDRALHRPVFSIALGTPSDRADLFSACDRAILLTDRTSTVSEEKPRPGPPPKSLPLFHPDSWGQALKAIRTRSF